jgi:hypothetical protein
MNRGVKPQVDLSQIAIFTPVTSQELFAQLWGRDTRTIRSQVARGYLPLYKVGKYNLINIVQLTRDSIFKSNYQQVTFLGQFYLDLPLMPQDVFANRVGVTDGVVRGWVIRGYVPSVISGGDRLINVAQLVVLCSQS